jgi:hypothetical protein
VLEQIRTVKAESVSAHRPSLLAPLGTAQDYAPVLGYVVRSLQAGGLSARTFFEHFVTDTEDWLAAGVAAGTIKPSRDPARRAHYLAQQGLGGLLLHVMLHDDHPQRDLHATVTALTETTALPALELFTEGLLADHQLLDEYVRYASGTSASSSRTDS